jgi:hypothetical protein
MTGIEFTGIFFNSPSDYFGETPKKLLLPTITILQ